MHPFDGSLELTLYAGNDFVPPPRDVVAVFHRWIQSDRLRDEVLIDVADYAHVYGGPGVVLVGRDTSYGVNDSDGRLGLVCRRKAPFAEGASAELRRVLLSACRVSRLLEEEPVFAGQMRFRADEIRLRILDRLAAPNDERTYRAVAGDVASTVQGLYRGAESIRVGPLPYSREPFGVRIEIQPAPDIGTLLTRW